MRLSASADACDLPRPRDGPASVDRRAPGKSSRKCPPRLSSRRRAARAISRATVGRLKRRRPSVGVRRARYCGLRRPRRPHRAARRRQRAVARAEQTRDAPHQVANCRRRLERTPVCGWLGSRGSGSALGLDARRRGRSSAVAAPRRLLHRFGGPRAEDEPSSSELLARRLAPWTPVQAVSPAAKSPRQRCAAPLVGVDAAHQVVRRRPDRNGILREVEPDLPAHLRRSSESARARGRRRDARASGRPVRRSPPTSRTMPRATTSRGARSPSGW